MLLNKIVFFRNCMMAMSLVCGSIEVFRGLVDRFCFDKYYYNIKLLGTYIPNLY